MRKRFFILWLFIFVMLELPMTARATSSEALNPEVTAVSTYCLDGRLYTFVRADDGYDLAQTEAVSSPPESSTAAETSATPASETTGHTDRRIVIAVVMFSGILAVVLLLLVLKRRNVKAKKNAVYIKLDVISGMYKGSKNTFYLVDELTIGSKSNCDIVWKSADVAPLNSRIFIKDRILYIEDLGSPNGTALGGMRLHAANRLRSGDEVSIGSICFRVRF